MGDPVVLPVVETLPPNSLPDVVPPNGSSDILLFTQETLRIKGRTCYSLPMGGIGRRSCCQGGRQLCLQVPPCQGLLFYRDLRVPFLKVVDDLLESGDRLGLGLRMPNPDELFLG